jgi:hypothetical protein
MVLSAFFEMETLLHTSPERIQIKDDVIKIDDNNAYFESITVDNQKYCVGDAGMFI